MFGIITTPVERRFSRKFFFACLLRAEFSPFLSFFRLFLGVSSSAAAAPSTLGDSSTGFDSASSLALRRSALLSLRAASLSVLDETSFATPSSFSCFLCSVGVSEDGDDSTPSNRFTRLPSRLSVLSLLYFDLQGSYDSSETSAISNVFHWLTSCDENNTQAQYFPTSYVISNKSFCLRLHSWMFQLQWSPQFAEIGDSLRTNHSKTKSHPSTMHEIFHRFCDWLHSTCAIRRQQNSTRAFWLVATAGNTVQYSFGNWHARLVIGNRIANNTANQHFVHSVLGLQSSPCPKCFELFEIQSLITYFCHQFNIRLQIAFRANNTQRYERFRQAHQSQNEKNLFGNPVTVFGWQQTLIFTQNVPCFYEISSASLTFYSNLH